MPVMQWRFIIGPESATNTGSGCVCATRKDALRRAITPPMSMGLMPSTVAGITGQLVRKRERTDRTNRGSESEEMAMTPTPPPGDEEAARPVPAWPLDGQRAAVSRTDERMPLRHCWDAAGMLFGYRSDVCGMSARTTPDCRQDAAWLNEERSPIKPRKQS